MSDVAAALVFIWVRLLCLFLLVQSRRWQFLCRIFSGLFWLLAVFCGLLLAAVRLFFKGMGA